MPLRHWLLISVLLWLTGCSLFVPKEQLEGAGNPELWQQHREQVSRIDSWQINGKVGIKAPQDSGSGTVFWVQRLDYFDLRLSGPLGRGAARLTGRPGAVLLEIAGEGRFDGNTPESVLEARLGWRLPVSHLLWWIRGLPVPNLPSQLKLNADSQLASLEQEGWSVVFSDYQAHQGYVLPERVKLEGQNLSVTFVIKEWQPRQLYP